MKVKDIFLDEKVVKMKREKVYTAKYLAQGLIISMGLINKVDFSKETSRQSKQCRLLCSYYFPYGLNITNKTGYNIHHNSYTFICK